MFNKEIGKDIGNYSENLFKSFYEISSQKGCMRSYTRLRINKISLTQETLEELKQTISFRGFELSLMEYIFYKEGKKIFVEKNWDLDDENYYVYSFFSSSLRTTEEIVKLTQNSEYTLIENLLDDCLVHIYYTNNHKKCYFQALDGHMIVGYSVRMSDEDKIKKDIVELIEYNKSPIYETQLNGELSDQPIRFYKNIKEHEIRFRESISTHEGIKSDSYLQIDSFRNNEYLKSSKTWDFGAKGKLELDVEDNDVYFTESTNIYSIFGGGENYKPSLLRRSLNQMEPFCLLISQIQDKRYFGTPRNS